MGRYRRRRRSSCSRGNGRPGSSSFIRIDKDEGEEPDGAVEDDAALASIDDDLDGKVESHSLGEEIPPTTEEPAS